MTAGQIRDTIRAVLCKGLTLEQAEQITRVLVPVRVSAGAPLMREGDGATGLFVLLTGTVEVLKKAPDGSSRSIARVEAPSVLGEMSLVMERPHSATVQAVTDCEIQLLTKSQFQRLISGESVAAYKLIAAIAEVLAVRLTRPDHKVLETSTHREGAGPNEVHHTTQQESFSAWSFSHLGFCVRINAIAAF